MRRAHVVVFTIEMSWETTDVLAADTADVLAADTRDVLAADKYVASEEVGLRRFFPGKNSNPFKKGVDFDDFWYI